MTIRQSTKNPLTDIESERWLSRERNSVDSSVLSSKKLFLIDINQTLLYEGDDGFTGSQREGIEEFIDAYVERGVTIAITTDSANNVEVNDGKRLNQYGRRHLERVLYWNMNILKSFEGKRTDPHDRTLFRRGVNTDFPWLASVDFFFGRKWSRYFKDSPDDVAQTCVKEYGAMAEVVGVSLGDCVVIGDRKSENTSVSGVDYLEIPGEGKYDFRTLIV
jgi:hypothetical protein